MPDATRLVSDESLATALVTQGTVDSGEQDHKSGALKQSMSLTFAFSISLHVWSPERQVVS